MSSGKLWGAGNATLILLPGKGDWRLNIKI